MKIEDIKKPKRKKDGGIKPATAAFCGRLSKVGEQVLTSARLRLLGTRVEYILITNFNLWRCWSLTLLLTPGNKFFDPVSVSDDFFANFSTNDACMLFIAD
jgi:hypothetical protein